jgi:uncharacterized SAM-binding protein YcdF (DUF218 family)
MRRLTGGAAKLALVTAAAFAGGFAAFVTTLPQPTSATPEGQGIVVLTGGDDRIKVALDLLTAGHGQRLLISGVNAATGRTALRNAHHADETAFACCVDIGWEAQNTPGNATEATRWARANGYSQLIVVTASYHMPRALLELREQMPDVTLIPYPVVPAALSRQDAWRNPETLTLLAGEYTKYVAAHARIGGDRLLRMAGI